ncbi:MAG: LysM domain-containing protein [Thermoleophilaceae bacterium]
MADQSPPSPLRLLAPAALAVVALVFLIIVAAGLFGGSEDQTPPEDAETKTAASKKLDPAKAPKPKPKQSATYTIKTGDSLGSIAEKTSVPVEKLQELNPELDSQALVSGQKIKLRE